MSHFSRIKTSIKNLDILKKTLADLNFHHDCIINSLRDSNGNIHQVDIIVNTLNDSKNLFGFSWDGNQYNIIADLQLWDQNMSFDKFIDKIMQQYALNSILDLTTQEGFKEVDKNINQDGSITLVMQRWI